MERSYDNRMAANGFLPYKMGYLTDWMTKKPEEELNETEENRAQALAELRKLIAKERNLAIWTDDSHLLQFLRARKFDPERAMELVRNLYAMFKDNPDIYPMLLDTSIANTVCGTNVGGAFPYRHKDGGVVIFMRAANWDPDQIPIQLAVLSLTALLLSLLEDPATQVCGVHVVYGGEYKLSHLRVISVRYIRLISRIIRNTMPIRFNAIHIVNESPILRYVFNIFKIFLSEKIMTRIHFHGNNMNQLHEYIPKEILPPEYGGNNINYSASESSCKNDLSQIVLILTVTFLVLKLSVWQISSLSVGWFRSL
ncbi:alpha-tocopherol transfer protein-like [Parasteatoda tepidariorum]|uniref:alpha-tocopherol transfer protein-like n=1 Tax=Parasteatoda tepidariorum TaxID=114398 RepID=UPI00077FB920|nr:alpha-tocopherol transfer protein-like isoform X1 [Parasteatoda tepidariorum]XP_042909019.1 alpha-tocopherol transfer protein-like isoform X1 [Parasteatoda tepidariorum]XP_042909020.1 alpha-tocopherol transfer protein-like isoform X1 [Parasteatoda tepidariorum]